ncbi:MAG: bacillithiol system redox-active protein YtxJ [Bacteroidota bacterium]
MKWNQLNNIDQIEDIKQESFVAPVLLFKHSTACSISSMAMSRMERNYDQSKVGDLKPYYLDLRSYRDISKKISEEFSVQHESPQAIVISKGEAIYDASHYDISFAEIAEKV